MATDAQETKTYEFEAGIDQGAYPERGDGDQEEFSPPRPHQEGGPEVFEAIMAIMEHFSEVGLQKNQQNIEQHFKFRGIDDVMNALSQQLVSNSLLIIPKALSRVVSERTNSRKSIITFSTVEMQYTFRSLVDGSETTSVMFGEASDFADKATNKAMSAAYKYMAIQTFCIPVDPKDNDADASSPGFTARDDGGYPEDGYREEPRRDRFDEGRRDPPRQQERQRDTRDDFPGDRDRGRTHTSGRDAPRDDRQREPQSQRQREPDNRQRQDQSRGRGQGDANKNASQARKDGDWERLISGMRLQRTEEELTAWGANHETDLARLPHNWKIHVREEYAAELKRVRKNDWEKSQRGLDRDFDPKTGEVREDEGFDTGGGYAARSGR